MQIGSQTTDVIVAGGGVAGATTAAALAGFGYRVLIVEPGLDHARRLAGELIHPPGAADLHDLGLLQPLKDAGGTPVDGFAVFPGCDQTESSAACLLSYAEVRNLKNKGLAIEHSRLAETILDAVAKRPNITVWKGGRITAIDLSNADAVSVTASCDAIDYRLRASLVVAADGRNSHVRRLAGITHKQVHISNMIGYTLRRSRLPHPGFGHVFIGGPSPVLAYQIAPGQTRIMFDLPRTSAHCSVADQQQHMDAHLKALPVAFRNDVQCEIATQTPIGSANYSIIPDSVIKRRIVCVGDAGGACHPLTATGLSACTRDAVRLRQAIAETSGGPAAALQEMPGVLQRFAQMRERPQRTRFTAAEVLYDVFRAQTPEMRLLRQGLFRYWRTSARGRSETMALLSTHEERLSAMVREYVNVCRFALPELIHWPAENESGPAQSRRHAMVGLARALVTFIAGVYVGHLPLGSK